MARYIHFYGDAGYCGTDYHEFQIFPDDATDAFLDGVSGDLAHSNAENYEHLATGWDDDFESEEERDCYYADAEGYWEELTQERYIEMKEDYGV